MNDKPKAPLWMWVAMLAFFILCCLALWTALGQFGLIVSVFLIQYFGFKEHVKSINQGKKHANVMRYLNNGRELSTKRFVYLLILLAVAFMCKQYFLTVYLAISFCVLRTLVKRVMDAYIESHSSANFTA